MNSTPENLSPPNTVTKIEPSQWRNLLAWQEFWKYRELLYFLTWRDVKVRYKQTAIGVLWAILQPVLTTAIFTVIFSRFARFDSIDVSYPLFALSGLLIWIFVSSSINTAGNSLISNSNLVTKVYFPRLIVPISATLGSLIDLILGSLILLGLMFYNRVNLTWQILLVPFFVGLAVLLAASLGTFFAALNVRFRDVKHTLPFALQIWMFASPVFYPPDILSEKWRFLLAFNPLTGILEGFRSSLFGKPFDWFAIEISVVITLVLTFISIFIFTRMEEDFADYI